MITYHGTNKLVLVKRAFNATVFGSFTCSAQYSCRASQMQYWSSRLIRGATLPGMEQFIIDGDVQIDVAQNGFATFNVTAFSAALGKIDSRTLF